MFPVETFENIAEVAATIIGLSTLISIFHQKNLIGSTLTGLT